MIIDDIAYPVLIYYLRPSTVLSLFLPLYLQAYSYISPLHFFYISLYFCHTIIIFIYHCGRLCFISVLITTNISPHLSVAYNECDKHQRVYYTQGFINPQLRNTTERKIDYTYLQATNVPNLILLNVYFWIRCIILILYLQSGSSMLQTAWYTI